MKRILIVTALLALAFLATGCNIISGGQVPSLPVGKTPSAMFVLDQPAYFQDGAILQADEEIIIDGISQEGVIISATLYDEDDRIAASNYDIVKSDGHFTLQITAPNASYDSYRLVISDTVNTLKIENLYFGMTLLIMGDGKIASLHEVDSSESVLASEEEFNKYIGVFVQETTTNYWLDLPSENAKMTEFAYWLVKNYQQKLDCPLAIINATVDQAHLDAWLSRMVIEDNLSVKNFLTNYDRYLDESMLQDDVIDQATYLYTHLITPLKNINCSQIVWNSGVTDLADTVNMTEEAASEYFRYYTYVLNKFCDLIRNDLHADIYILQAPSLESTYAASLRQCQSTVSYLYSYANIIPTYDLHQITYDEEEQEIVGELDYQLLAERIVKLIEDADIEQYSPSYTHCVTTTSEIRIQISYCRNLMLKDDATDINNFIVLDENGLEMTCEYSFEHDWIVITLPFSEEKVKTIAYAWDSEIYDSNLTNEEGMPVVPFKIVFE